MPFILIVHHYLLWHYSRAFFEIFHVWFNFLWFIVHLFSLPQLLRTWFSPWKRMTENRGNQWNIEDLAAFVIINLISRIIGFIIRTAIIVIGFTSLTLAVVAGFAVYIFWIIAPFTIIGLIGLGLTLLIA